MDIRSFDSCVDGMVCPQCEGILCSQLNDMRGIVSSKASYWRQQVSIRYDADLLDENELKGALVRFGYPGCSRRQRFAQRLATLALFVAAYLAIPLVSLPNVPQLYEAVSPGYLFLAGLAAGTHCVVMCGGIQMAQHVGRANGAKGGAGGCGNVFRYNLGRIAMYTLLGAVVGAMGGLIAYTDTVRSMIYVFGGAAVLFVGLCMWGVFPAFRYLQSELPKICHLPQGLRKMPLYLPVVAGMLTACIPCAASGTMWAYVLALSSPFAGAVAMFCWSVGTAVCMVVFGILSSASMKRFNRLFQCLNTALICALGARMLLRGLQYFC